MITVYWWAAVSAVWTAGCLGYIIGSVLATNKAIRMWQGHR